VRSADDLDSWLSLGLELAAVLALRSLYAAWIVRRAWRQGSGSPWSFVRAAGRALIFYATTSVLLWPWVALLFGGAISHLYYKAFPIYAERASRTGRWGILYSSRPASTRGGARRRRLRSPTGS
jgi:hypothetical protein